jgi:hypothetical protein
MPSLGALADAFRDGAPAAAQLRVSLATRDAAAIVRSVCDKRNFAKSVRGRRSVVFHCFYASIFAGRRLRVRGRDPRARRRAGQESEIPNFKGSSLSRFLLVSADFWTSDHLSERPRSVDAFSGTRARETLTLKRR